MTALTRRRRYRRGEAGSEIIECALALPLVLMVALGIVDFGLLFQRYEVVTNAAHEGARVAALPGYSNTDVQARVTSYLTVTEQAKSRGFPADRVSERRHRDSRGDRRRIAWLGSLTCRRRVAISRFDTLS